FVALFALAARADAANVAALQITVTLAQVVHIIATGCSNIATVDVGRAVGAQQPVLRMAGSALAAAALLQGPFLLLFAGFHESLVGAFTSDEHVRGLVRPMIGPLIALFML